MAADRRKDPADLLVCGVGLALILAAALCSNLF